MKRKGIADFKGIKKISQIVLLVQNENAVCTGNSTWYKLHFCFYEVKIICAIPFIPLKSAIPFRSILNS
ncbi:hypothetical protein EGI32_15790 [Ferruginibacter sp. HRS2-29]|nr:hypothetical protein [Ferruginibacter sp. HRS2-29]